MSYRRERLDADVRVIFLATSLHGPVDQSGDASFYHYSDKLQISYCSVDQVYRTLYSSVMVVLNMNGDPRATAHARARSVARPDTSWWTANDALIPAPFLDLPYRNVMMEKIIGYQRKCCSCR